MRIQASAALLALFTASIPAVAQAPAVPKYLSIIGTIEKVDTGAKSMALKTDKGEESSIKFDDRTQFLMLPAGEKDTKKATRASASDVGAGDRVIARMKQEDPTGQPAVFLYFSKQADLAQRQKKTAEEWQTQSVAGTVKSIDASAKQITIAVRGGFGPAKDMTLDATGSVDYERYNPDAGKYDPSTAGVAAIQVGDQVRVLGQKNADQTSIKLEAMMSGSFKTIPVQIKTIDVATKTITGTDLGSKKPITIAIKADTTLKKLDDATALLMARRLNPSFQAEGGRGGRGNRGQGAGAAEPGAGQAPDGGRGNFAGGGNFAGRGGQGGGRAGRNADPSKLLETQPTIEFADLKAGEPVVVTGAASNDPSKLTAMSLVAGVDPILRAAPQNGADPLGGSWNFGDVSAPQ
ncbi:MAG TPA: hypothetical protein VHZ74_03370 [Bryobacteraceae bacterium]|nr:hypothetical protein [Bryobacteraceae bacterium]